MGANAQTSVPAFTAGQVLTAAQMTQVNTGIPVFASSTERDAAFGGTGEKTLAEGQMAYLEDTNATQYYDGSAWSAVAGGKILQIVRATDSTLRTITATSWVDVTNLSVDITPSSATSTILVIGSVQGFVQDTGGPIGVLNVRLYDGTSALSGAEAATLRTDNATGVGYDALITMIGYDAPATTSTVTYKIQAQQASSTSAKIKNDVNTGQIYAIEVAG